MQTRIRIAAALAGLGLVAVLQSGCEDTDVTAPAGSTITLVANAIQVNSDAGETQGSTRIRALLLDEGGSPVQEVPLAFTTTGGTLSSNLCEASRCTATGTDCSVDADCPTTTVDAIETDENGVARVLLTMVVFQDPNSVVVSVTSSVTSATITVNMIVNTGPQDPVPSISAIPSSGQRTGRSFTFNGTSTKDPSIPRIYCWDWSITSSTQPSRFVRGPQATTVGFTGVGSASDSTGGDHDLSVNLRVSDEVSIVCPDYDSNNGGTNTPPPSSQFSPNVASLTYQIRCDLTAPVSVNAGSNRFLTITNSTQNCAPPEFDPADKCASVVLQASGDDPESPRLRYNWDCGNEVEGCDDPLEMDPDPEDVGPGAPDRWGYCQSVTCHYDTAGAHEARVTVTNECGLSSSDSVIINVVDNTE